MEKTEYAEITIEISAPEDQVNDLVKESKLSDEYSKIANDLNAWLTFRLRNTPFTFTVNVD